ncbi:two-pore potassium channel 5-like isoform X2 [Macadamia integrifolia]|uniref:two-pore potassium channel 5-like isoform X2 n=1 Tax=Macadamia integrifolia TaxID=60698 RepID=UPI001C500AD9|nr:two-pore potassium channel 5-like isoform X2 [Macadamia integrifolia]
MDGELFRSSRGDRDNTHQLECHQHEHQDDSTSSSSFKIPNLQPFTSRTIFEETPETETEIVPSPSLLSSSSFTDFRPPDGRKKAGLQRSKTAPAMAVMRDLRQQQTKTQMPQFESNSIIRQAIFFLIIYLSLGVLIYSFSKDHFSGFETHPVVDALYFCIVTMCTIGYGDIAPLTPAAKLFACIFVLVGFGFIGILLSGTVNYVLDLQENMILTSIRAGTGAGGFSAKNYIFDLEKGRMRIRMKVGLALGVVVLCIGTGAMIFYFVEHLDLVDSVYLSVMSVTTVGYGDRAFETLPGRLFASLWLLFSTLAVARAFLYLAEARIDKRHRRITNWVLQRGITVEDFLAADVNNNGFIRKLDRHNSGKITLPDILESS